MKKTSKIMLAIIGIVFSCAILLIFISAVKAEDLDSISKEKKALHHQSNGNRYDDASKFKEAVVEYKESLKYAPDDPNTHFNLGQVYLKINNPEEAVKAFEKVIEIEPKDSEAHNLLGIAFRGCGKSKEAVRTWKKSLKINPDQPEVQQMIKETIETMK